jgi:hypothetical protein
LTPSYITPSIRFNSPLTVRASILQPTAQYEQVVTVWSSFHSWSE